MASVAQDFLHAFLGFRGRNFCTDSKRVLPIIYPGHSVFRDIVFFRSDEPRCVHILSSVVDALYPHDVVACALLFLIFSTHLHNLRCEHHNFPQFGTVLSFPVRLTSMVQTCITQFASASTFKNNQNSRSYLNFPHDLFTLQSCFTRGSCSMS